MIKTERRNKNETNLNNSIIINDSYVRMEYIYRNADSNIIGIGDIHTNKKYEGVMPLYFFAYFGASIFPMLTSFMLSFNSWLPLSETNLPIRYGSSAAGERAKSNPNSLALESFCPSRPL